MTLVKFICKDLSLVPVDIQMEIKDYVDQLALLDDSCWLEVDKDFYIQKRQLIAVTVVRK